MWARHLISQLLLGALLVCPTTCLLGSENVHRTPFEVERNHFIVVQGSIKKHPVRIKIDTGASHTILNRATARRLGIRLLTNKRNSVRSFGHSRRLPRVVVSHLQLGTYSIPPVACLAGDLAFAGVDVILGLDVLRRASLTIDYEEQMVEFGSSRRFGASVPLESGTRFVVVPVEIQGHAVRLAIDSGAARINLYRERIKPWWDELTVTGHARIDTLTGWSRVKTVTLRGLKLDGSIWARHEGFLLEVAPDIPADGVLGLAQLNLRRIHFDFSNQQVSFQR